MGHYFSFLLGVTFAVAIFVAPAGYQTELTFWDPGGYGFSVFLLSRTYRFLFRL